MTTLILSFLFGSIGVAYFIYGKKQRKMTPALAGLGLLAFPYLMANPFGMALVGSILTAAPWLLRE